MENNDIVVRLREVPNGIGGYFYRTTQQAADEIERLRNELDGSQLAYRGASYDRDRMRAERDEARREVCVLMQRTGFLRGDYAAERGWDCFKENSND